MGSSDSSEVFAKYVVVKIEDSFGNHLDISYELANAFSRPKKVLASDGREVTFEYTNFDLTSVTDQEITVHYNYLNGHLSSVEYPEETIFQYQYKDNTRLLSKVTTPLGADISIEWDNYFFRNKDYPVVTSKCVDEFCWTYHYAREYSGNSAVEDVTTIETPYDTTEVYHHITPQAVANGEIWKIGLLTKKELFGFVLTDSAFGSEDFAIQTIDYVWESAVYSQEDRSYQNTGVVLFDQAYSKPVLKSTTEEKYNSTYTYEVLSRTLAGQPIVEKWTGTGTYYTKKHYFTQGDYQQQWLLELPSQETVSDHNGDFEFVSGSNYNSLGQVTRRAKKGAETFFTYYPDGTLESVKDGEGNITTYDDYYRGIARSVNYPDLTSSSRTVDSRGRITSETDPNSITYHYNYDELDRVTFIDMPLTEDVTISYTNSGKNKRFVKGSLSELYNYNERGNLVKHTRQDTVSGKQFIRHFDYNERNQLTFESYINDPQKGTFYSYDGHGELYKIDTSNLETIKYLRANNALTTTDARGYKSTREFETYSYADQRLKIIDAPENQFIEIERNILGQPLTITQNGIVREFGYNVNWLLDYYKNPEVGAEYTYYYDTAGRRQTEVVGTSENKYVISYYYDPMGRIASIDYSDRYVAQLYPWSLFIPEVCGTPSTGYVCGYTAFSDQYEFEYDFVGNLKTKTKLRGGILLDGGIPLTWDEQTSWRYEYNDENRLTLEALNYKGKEYALEYTYNELGNLDSITYPNAYTVDYHPDPFGRATRVGNIVQSVQYFDQGPLKSVQFGNGLTQTYTLNSRFLPESLRFGTNGELLQFTFDYDLNNNILSIQDNLDASRSRYMEYDQLNRLKSASGSWGISTYQYDALSNIKHKTLNGRNYSYQYNTQNQLTSFDGMPFQYDLYGRVIKDGRNQYYYDFSNNLLKAQSLITADATEYQYDANDRMVSRTERKALETTIDPTTHSIVATKVQTMDGLFVYSSAGKLMYEEKNSGDLKRDHIYLGGKLVGYHDLRVDCQDDLDGDGIGHCYERDNGLNPSVADADQDLDGDGLSNLEEYLAGTRANLSDSDADGVDDLTEINIGLDPLVDDANVDLDNDGFTTLQEILQGSDPTEFTKILAPSVLGAAYNADGTTSVYWNDVRFATSYDIYWSEQPFFDLSNASKLENVKPPLLHDVQTSAEALYYRVVANNSAQTSDGSPERVAYRTEKDWHIVGSFDSNINYTLDGEGNVFLMDGYWSQVDHELHAYSVLEDEDISATSITASQSGYVLKIATSLGNGGRLMAAVFNPFTKTWSTKELKNLTTNHWAKNIRVVASDNGHFLVSWLDDGTYSFEADASYFQVWSPESGWGQRRSIPYIDASSEYSGQAANVLADQISNNGEVVLAFQAANSSDSPTHILLVSPEGTTLDHPVFSGDWLRNISISISDTSQVLVAWDLNGTDLHTQEFTFDGEFEEPIYVGDAGLLRAEYLDDSVETLFYYNHINNEIFVSTKVAGATTWQPGIPLGSSGENTLTKSTKTSSNTSAYGGKNVLLGERQFHVNYDGVLQVEEIDVSALMNPSSTLTINGIEGINILGNAAGKAVANVSGERALLVYRSDIEKDNIPPFARAGEDILLVSSPPTNELYLNASRSYDSDGVIVSYKWQQLSGPETNISSSGSSYPSQYLRIQDNWQAIYVFELTVTDDKGATAQDTVVVMVNSSFVLPKADAGATQLVYEGYRVQLIGINSGADADIPIARYFWTQSEGPQVVLSDPTSPNPSYQAPPVSETTVIRFTLQIYTEGDQYTDSDTVEHYVSKAGTSADAFPQPAIGERQTAGPVNSGDRVILDYSESYDPDGGDVTVTYTMHAYWIALVQGSDPGTMEFTAPEGIDEPVTFSYEVSIQDDEGNIVTLLDFVTVNPVEVGDDIPTVGDFFEVDLGGPDFVSSAKNQLEVDTTALSNLYEIGGYLSNIGLTMLSPFDQYSSSGVENGNWPRGSIDNLVVGDGSEHASALNQSATVQIEHLNPNGLYNVILYASETDDDGGRGRLTRYTINGSQYQDLQVTNNTANFAVFMGVQPKPDGTITITTHVSPEGTARYAHLGFIGLEYSSETNVLPPQIEVEFRNIQFGAIALGESVEKVVTVSNTGELPLDIGSPRFNGGADDNYSIINDQCSGKQLPGAASCTFTIRFAPTVAGFCSTEVTLYSNDPDSSSSGIGLDGYCVEAYEAFSEGVSTQIDFGNYSSYGFINNVGADRLEIVGLLLPGSERRYANVRLTVDQPFDASWTTGLQNSPLGLADSIVMDTLVVGDGSEHADAVNRTVTIKIENLNSNDRYSLFLFASAAGDDAGRGYLTRYTVNGGAYQDLDASDNTENYVEFTGLAPDAEGNLTLQVSVSPEGSARYAHLGYLVLTNQGTFEPPAQSIEVSSNILDFGSVEIGSTGTLELTISNTGPGPLTVQSLHLTGTDATQFSLIADSCSNVALDPASSCNLVVQYGPSTEATHQASLMITSDDAATPSLASGLIGIGFYHPVEPSAQYYNEQNGLVVMEAERFSGRAESFESFNWEIVSPSEALGGGAVQAPVEASHEPPVSFEVDNARIDYEIEFSQPGTYYLWMYGVSPDGNSDTLYPGWDGVPHSSGSYFRILPENGWSWSKIKQNGGAFTFLVEAPGRHTLNLWMRESDMIIDRILLTTDSSFVPSGNGPVESAYSGGSEPGMVATPLISPAGSSFATTIEVSLQSGTTGAAIYFTTDGSTPTTNSLLYNGPITLTESAQIRAMAVMAGYTDSAVAVATFTKQNVAPVLATIPDQTVTAGETMSFTVQATDADSGIPALSATGLPEGASFVDAGDGSASYTWTTTTEDVGTHSITITATDALDTSIIHSQSVTLRVNEVPAQGGLIYSESGGLVVMEAEHFSARAESFEGYHWQVVTPIEAIGEGAIQAPLAASTAPPVSFEVDNARVDYQIEFTQVGTYYLWVYGYSADGNADTVYPGWDGVPHISGNFFRIAPANGWSWSKTTQAGTVMTFDVIAPGRHTLNLWMRETRIIIDRILLTTDSSFVPSGNGPTESATNQNVAPVLATIPDQTVTAGETMSFTVQATDADSGIPALSATGLPEGASFIDAGDGSASFTWTTTVEDVGTHSITVVATDALDSSISHSQSVTLTVNEVPSQGGLIYSETGGLVVMEAEHFSARAESFEGYHWQVVTPIEAIGEGAIQAPLAASTAPPVSFEVDNARVDYQIEFTQAGTYYLWIYGYSADGNADTVYPGWDGVPHVSGNFFRIAPANGWSWSKTTQAGTVMTFDVPAPGRHALNLWMRETRFIIDRILLTTNSNFVPSGNGPEESQYE